MSPADPLQQLKDLFDCFDKDTSGALSVQGLSHIADSDSRELHELLVAADINTDGVITRTEWDQHVSSWFEGHEGQVQAILDAASGITEEVLQTKRKKVRSKRQIAAVWDGARSDGEDEIGWFGLPAVASQDLSFKAENRAVPIGQKLEVMVGGSCFLCEVAAYDEDQDYPYLLHFPAGDVKEKRCMIDVTSSRIIAPLWTREKAPFHFIDAEEEVSPLEMLTSHANGEPINPSQMVSLVRRARQQFQSEPALLRIPLQGASVSIFGDIHGNFAGFASLASQLQGSGKAKLDAVKDAMLQPPADIVIFLGDLVDRGDENLKLLLTVLAWKVQHPDRIFLLRGNHEDENINCRYGFEKECRDLFGEDGKKIYRQVNNMFNYLPVAAVLGDFAFCCHGGLGPSILSLADVSLLDAHKPISLEVPPSTNMDKTAIDLLWADPCEEVDADVNADGFAENSARGMGHVWNAAASRKFLETTGLKIIIRGHECEPAGYLYNHDRQVLTIFSSPAYSENNDAAVATLDASGLSSLNFLRVNAKNEPVSAAAQLEDRDSLQRKAKPRSVCQGCVSF